MSSRLFVLTMKNTPIAAPSKQEVVLPDAVLALAAVVHDEQHDHGQRGDREQLEEVAEAVDHDHAEDGLGRIVVPLPEEQQEPVSGRARPASASRPAAESRPFLTRSKTRTVRATSVRQISGAIAASPLR